MSLQLEMFSIHDQAADAYINPFFFPNKNMAIRSFSQCINDQSHAFHRSPGDYTLFHLGQFDTPTGKITPNKAPTTMGNGVQFVNPIPEPTFTPD